MRLSHIVSVSVVMTAHAVLCTSLGTGAAITVPAFNNATVQPAGPRTGGNVPAGNCGIGSYCRGTLAKAQALDIPDWRFGIVCR